MRKVVTDLDVRGELTVQGLPVQGTSSGASELTLVTWSRSGTAAVLTGTSRFYNPTADVLPLISLRVSADTAPTGASLNVAVVKNDTTTIATASITAGQYTSGRVTLTAVELAVGDFITIDITQIGSTVPGADITVQVECGTTGSFGLFQDYTPALTAATTNPTLGSGSSALGRWSRVGDLVVGQVGIVFGSSGVNAGSGTYYVSLPVAARQRVGQEGAVVGNGHAYDSSTPVYDGPFNLVLSSTDNTVAVMRKGGASGTYGAAVPWTWAAGDFITCTLMYEAAT